MLLKMLLSAIKNAIKCYYVIKNAIKNILSY